MVGRQVDELYTHSPRSPGEVVLEVTNLAGARKPATASLQLRRGEVLGIAGLVGAGRSELLLDILALDPLLPGSVRVLAHAGPASPLRRWQQGAGMLSEDRKSEGLALNLSIAENLALPGLPWWTRPSTLAAQAATWVDRLGIRCAGPTQPVGDLSGGNQQKVA